MDISKFPERIISGIAHLIWISILILIIADTSHIEVINHLSEIGTGTAALYVSIVIGLSFFFGNLFDNIIIIIVKIYMRRTGRSPRPISSLDREIRKINKDQVKDLQNKYTDKAFFRSISFAGIGIIGFSIIWSFQYGIPNLSLVLLGLCFELLVIIVYRTLRLVYNELYDELNNRVE